MPPETGDEAILASPATRRCLRRAGPARWRAAQRDGDRSRATEIVELPRSSFRELIATEPAVRDVLLASLAGELRRLTMHVEELHFLDMTGRVAARLVRLTGEVGVLDADGVIHLPSTLTQGELAAMVGSTRQTVNKLLGQFADDGLIRLDRAGIVILDLQGLIQMARR